MAWTRSNSARLATWVNGSLVAFSCRLWHRCSSEVSDEASWNSRIAPCEMPCSSMHGDGVGIDGHRPLAAAENRQPAQRLHAAADGRMHGAVGLADARVPFRRTGPAVPGATSARARWPPAMPVSRSAPRFHSITRPAASINTTASYMLSSSRPWKQRVDAGLASPAKGCSSTPSRNRPDPDRATAANDGPPPNESPSGRPGGTRRTARTNSGSNCVPEHSNSSAIARSCERAGR